MATEPTLGPRDVELRPRKARKTRIEIPLARSSRPYLPGSGPPLQPISLLPIDDSTAYIVERILLPSPGPAADGKPLPRRMTYVVGWRDLPAARRLVPAMDILDYVSPRALEQWEYDVEAQLEQDRKELAEQPHAGQRKGRPPAHTDIESAAVAEPEPATPSRIKKGTMSLLTPRNTRLDDFEGLSDEESASPSRQAAHSRDRQSASDVDDAAVADGKQPELQLGLLPGRPEADTLRPSAATPSGRPAPARVGFSGLTPLGSLSQGARPLCASSPVAASAGFTPLNGISRRNAPRKTTPTPEPAPTGDATMVPVPKPRKPRKTPSKPTTASEPVLDETGEPAWTVLRLEDMAVYDVEGQGLVRYFQVRWEGDWPPDENPTWEPEENIPPNMVRNFFKRGKKRKRAPPARGRSAKATKMSRSLNTHYKSVSEAFAGEVTQDVLGLVDDEEVLGVGAQASLDEGGDDASDLLVVDEERAPPTFSFRAANGLRALTFGLL